MAESVLTTNRNTSLSKTIIGTDGYNYHKQGTSSIIVTECSSLLQMILLRPVTDDSAYLCDYSISEYAYVYGRASDSCSY